MSSDIDSVGFDLEACLATLGDVDPDRCTVSPSPELSDKIRAETERLSGQKRVKELAARVQFGMPHSPGLNDGLIIPGSHFPLGTSIERVRSAGADRAPLHGVIRIAVVLVDFDDKPMVETASHFQDLFFSNGVLANGSVKEYFAEVTNGLVDLQGVVVGPLRMPQDLSDYANGASGTGPSLPNARTMARDAALASDSLINFDAYDNDANGFVDAFIVVHAGPGAEQTGNPGHIWSHKWVLSGGALSVDTTQIYAYLTVPEDAQIGVCAHEIGHLVFGFPDLYDTDNTSEGIGKWCLMAGGSWGGSGAGAAAGEIPTHPSAWCKAQQAWVTVNNVTANGSVTIADVKDGHTIHRLWKDGGGGQEYFLVENRQKTRFDADLPGEGLLIWHIDDAISNNTNETHYKVALEQADGLRDLENNTDRGDTGDPYPGSSDNRSFNNTSTPNSKSYGGVDTCVSVTAISDSGAVMTANLTVKCGKSLTKDVKDGKDTSKEKEARWEWKDWRKDAKDNFEKRRWEKRPEKPEIDKRAAYDKFPDDKFTDNKFGDDKFTDNKLSDRKVTDGKFRDKLGEGGDLRRPAGPDQSSAGLEARVAALEAMLGAGDPFIGGDLRPDLADSALTYEEQTGGALVDKRSYDTKATDA